MSTLRFNGPQELIKAAHPADLDFTLESSPERRQEITQMLGAIGLSEALLSKHAYGLSEGNKPATGVYTEHEAFRHGRDESQHQVGFGQLIFHDRNRANRPELVAKKPFDEPIPHDIYQELAALNHLNSIGEIQNTYLPLGVWRNAQGILQTITLYEHGVVSTDQTFWADKSLSPEELRPERVRTSFQDCLWGIGYLHGAGISHGDAQVKNLAHDSKGVRFIDPESMRLLPRDEHGQLQESFASESAKKRDIETLLATSFQVEENRPEIIKAINGEKGAKELALWYRKGLRKGAKDSDLRLAKIDASESNTYFEYILGDMLSKMNSHKAQSPEIFAN